MRVTGVSESAMAVSPRWSCDTRDRSDTLGIRQQSTPVGRQFHRQRRNALYPTHANDQIQSLQPRVLRQYGGFYPPDDFSSFAASQTAGTDGLLQIRSETNTFGGNITATAAFDLIKACYLCIQRHRHCPSSSESGSSRRAVAVCCVPQRSSRRSDLHSVLYQLFQGSERSDHISPTHP